MFALGHSATILRGKPLLGLAWAALIAVAAGCSGGGASSSALPQGSGSGTTTIVGAPTSSSTATAKLTITIPAKSASAAASAKRRLPQYISSATNSATFTVAGGSPIVIPLASGSPNCTTATSGAVTCAINVSVPSGPAVAFVFSTFASTNGTGTPLSTTSATQAIVANAANAINITLNAVVSTLQVSLSSSFTIGTAATSTVNVNVLDAGGEIIAVGTNALVDANNNPVTITLSDSETTATKLSATTVSATPATVSYTGGTPSTTSATISAVATSSAGIVASATTPMLFAGAGANGLALPPQMIYNSCEVDTNLAGCEAEDTDMASDGFKYEINYLSLLANKTGSGSLQALFAYDASIGFKQFVSLKEALNDPVDPLTGTRLVSSSGATDGNLAKSCGAINNEQVIQCVASLGAASAGFGGWYIYDEPGCPDQTQGRCLGSIAGKNYAFVDELAAFIAQVDPTHPIIGIQNGDSTTPAIANQMFSCNGAAPCTSPSPYPWLVSSITPNTGFDLYPFCDAAPGSTPGTVCGPGTSFENAQAIAENATNIPLTIAAQYAPETLSAVLQAFSWFQESGTGCTTINNCLYPTQAEMQYARDLALYNARAAGKPLSYIGWYYWPDITCLTSYTGCSATANRAALKAAAFAPYPLTAPTPFPTQSSTTADQRYREPAPGK
jgi:hypothetical protein